MSDNVLPFQSKPLQEESRTARTIAFLRQLADDIEKAPEGVHTAIAFFAECDGELDVMCGGFMDDTAAIRYLTAFIRNQGFAE